MIDSLEEIKLRLLEEFDNQIINLRKALEDDDWINFNSEMTEKQNKVISTIKEIWEVKTKRAEWNNTIKKGA